MMRVGIDVLEVDRVKDLNENRSKLAKILTQNEINYVDKICDKLPRLAGIYAVKESFLKALGVGILNGVSFLDFEVLHEQSGRPYLKILSHNNKYLKDVDECSIDISISHTKKLATAICIMK